MQKTKVLLWMILLLCGFSAEASSVIKSIRYEGNDVTQVSVLNRELYISPGDKFDEVLVEKSRQSIMDLGLFKSVRYYLQEDYIDNTAVEGVSEIEVVFIVEEKYYIFAIPRLKLEDDNIYVGAQFQWDNVLGLNHRTRLFFQNRGRVNGITQRRKTFSYFYPNINDSAYALDLRIQESNGVDDEFNRQDDSYKVALLRWINESGRSRGWFAGGSVIYQQRFSDAITEDVISENLEAVILGIDVGFRDLNEYEYNRGGKAYGYKMDWAHRSIGSEEEFTKFQLYYRSYYRYKNRPATNLNVQTRFGHANNMILGNYAFNLGTSADLRGYENGRFRGNTMLLTNAEYMFPHYKYPVIRYVTFIDVGNTYDSIRDILHRPLNVGAGFGLRWKLRSFVKVDLRMDIGYGFTDHNYKLSFGTRNKF